MNQKTISPFFFAPLFALAACGGGGKDFEEEGMVETSVANARPSSVNRIEEEQEEEDTSADDDVAPEEDTVTCNVDKECPGADDICVDHACVAFADTDDELTCKNGRILVNGKCEDPPEEDTVTFGASTPEVVVTDDGEVIVTQPEPEVTEPEPTVTEPEPPAAEPEAPVNDTETNVCIHTDADCNHGRVIDKTLCACVEDEETCDVPGEVEACGEGKERYCAENYRWSMCRAVSQPLPDPVVEPEPVAEPEAPAEQQCVVDANCTNDATATCIAGVCVAQPEPVVEPAVEPEPTPEPVAEPAVEPVVEPAPQPEPVVEPAPTVANLTFVIPVDAQSITLDLYKGAVNDKGEPVSRHVVCAEGTSGFNCTVMDVKIGAELGGQVTIVKNDGTTDWISKWTVSSDLCEMPYEMELIDENGLLLADYSNTPSSDFPYHMTSKPTDNGSCWFNLAFGWTL